MTSSTPIASGTISSQCASGLFVMVTKSADMKTLVTPGSASRGAATGSSVGWPAAKDFGASNNALTLNFSDPARRLILEPAKYTFVRPLGDLE